MVTLGTAVSAGIGLTGFCYRYNMARIRTIKPEFWTSRRIAECSTNARLLFVAILNMADDEGLLTWDARLIRAFAFAYDDFTIADVESWMCELEGASLVTSYIASSDGYMYAQVKGFREHQRIDRPRKSTLPKPQFDEASTNIRRSIDEQSTLERKGKEGKGTGKGREGGAGGVTAVAVTTRSPAKRFQPPDPDESLSFAREMGMTQNQHDQWRDYYESNGWKVGRNPMKDWKATMRRWKRTDAAKQQTPGTRFTITKDNLDEQQRKTDEAWKAHFGTDRRLPGQGGQDPDSLPEHQH